MCIWSIAVWRRVPRTLGAWEVLLEYLSCLASYFVWEVDFEFHDQISSFVGVLGERQPFPKQSLHRAWLDDIIAGQRDHSPINGGNVHSTATQVL